MAEEHDSKPAIALSGVDFTWPERHFGLGIESFSVAQGETVLLLGESGAGKSTLLSLICGIMRPQAGAIWVEGKHLGPMSNAERDRFRADTFGIVFQMFNLLPYASALDNILVPLRFSPERRARCDDPEAEALRLAKALGLDRSLVTQGTAGSLSVGQQQRVAVARALIGRPPILVADEPTSALDATKRNEFMDLVFDQIRDSGTTFLMVSHNPTLAERFDRSMQLSDIARSHTRTSR